MAFYRLSERGMNELQGEIAKKERKIEQLTIKQKALKAANKAKTAGEIIGTGLLMGALRGKFEDKATKQFNVPYLDFDAELALGVAITGAALFDAFGPRYSNDALIVGSTIIAGFARGFAKNWMVSGEMKLTGVGATALPDWVGYNAASPDLVDSLASTSLF